MNTECFYCTRSSGDVKGVIEIFEGENFISFTPTADDSSGTCKIYVSDVFECGVVSCPMEEREEEEIIIHYLQVNMKSAGPTSFVEEDPLCGLRNVFFRFPSKKEAVKICSQILPMMINGAPHGKSQVPFFSDHIHVTPLVSPENKIVNRISKELNDTLTVGSNDKPAREFRGRFLLSANPDWFFQIKEMLPFQYKFCEMRLLFSPKIHGISVPAFFRRVDTMPFPSIMILKDSSSQKNCCVLGAFCQSPWTLSNSRRFFGSSENFVFSLSKNGQPKVEVFSSFSGKNRFFQFCDDRRIVIGSGGAISVFDDWLRGSSRPCETFNTAESLTCTSEFILGDIEFWALLPDSAKNEDLGFPIH